MGSPVADYATWADVANIINRYDLSLTLPPGTKAGNKGEQAAVAAIEMATLQVKRG